MARISKLVLAVAACALVLLSSRASAQATSSTTSRAVPFEIVSVDGNKVVAKTDRGYREVTVPPDFKINMDGKDIGVGDLKPGMKGTAMVDTTTTSTPVTVTDVKNGQVLAVAGNSIIVAQDGTTKKYTLGDVRDRNATIYKDGQRVELSQLKVGDMLTAQIITRKPPTVTTSTSIKSASVMGGGAASKPAAAAPAASAPAAASSAPEASASSGGGSSMAGSSKGKKLPKTASDLPLLALAGALLLATGASLTAVRRFKTAR
jgi:LPXTG-motif cell wall-anchored protein